MAGTEAAKRKGRSTDTIHNSGNLRNRRLFIFFLLDFIKPQSEPGLYPKEITGFSTSPLCESNLRKHIGTPLIRCGNLGDIEKFSPTHIAWEKYS